MNMDKKKGTLTSDSRMAEDRRLGGTVPASRMSSSSQGQAAESLVSSADLIAITRDIDEMGESLLEIRRQQENLAKVDASLSAESMQQLEVHREDLDGRTKIGKRVLDDSEDSEEKYDRPGTSGTSQMEMYVTSESIVISSEDEFAAPRPASKKKGKEHKEKRRKIKNSPILERDRSMEDQEDFDAHFSLEGKTRVEQELTGLEIAHASEVHERMNAWIAKLETMRRKSKNIKGSFSGQMKIMLECCKKASDILSIKATAKEDPLYWKEKVEAMKKENTDLRCKVDAIEKELERMRQREFVRDAYSDRSGSKSSGRLPAQSASSPRQRKGKELLATTEKTVPSTNNEVVATGDRHGEKNLETILGCFLDKFSAEVLSPISNVACDIRMLAKLITDGKGQRDADQLPHSVEQRKVGDDTLIINNAVDSGRKRVTRKRPKSPGLANRKASTPVGKILGRNGGQFAEEYDSDKFMGSPAVSGPSMANQPRIIENRQVKLKVAPSKIREPVEQGRKKESMLPLLRKKVPKTTAVAITCVDEKISYAEILKKARDNIPLDSLDIKDANIRRAMTGGVIIEIAEDEKGEKANNLRDRLNAVLDSSRIRVSCPVKKTQVRLSGVDDSITIDEIKQALAKIGECRDDLIECSEIKFFRGSLGVAWAQCPMSVALKVKEAGDKMRIGWSRIKVEVLKPRPVQCYRCLAAGHTYQRCPSRIDRRDCCRKCGEKGHFSKWCSNKTSCPICKESGRPANHRAGSVNCPPVPPRRGGKDVDPEDRRLPASPTEQRMECEVEGNG